MTLRLLPPPTRAEFGLLRVHELIRDYPELRRALDGLGIEAGAHGEGALATVLADCGYGAGEADMLFSVLLWRRGSTG